MERLAVIVRTSTVRAKHQPYGENINRTRKTSTAKAKHQPYEENINHTRRTSIAQANHRPYEENMLTSFGDRIINDTAIKTL
ncbi:hypothetical protein [Virgibacillus ihumii]|uniref:hypothetical protein n=1 Tax=Virgibacillus ihumii TaxID=2686091 RepID=UPI00157D85D8|nr:hypothetical protein [Virgibacillus ihumii]